MSNIYSLTVRKPLLPPNAIAEKMMARRGRTLTEADKTIFEVIYNQAEK